MAVVEASLDELLALRERRRDGISLAEEAEKLSGSFRLFVRAAWHVVQPRVDYVHGWHVDSICDHLEAVTEGDIRKLQIWVPPGSMKSLNVSVFWPAWEWTRKPWLRYMTGSYGQKLATDLAVMTRDLVESEWYMSRWEVRLKDDENQKQSYLTTDGGGRFVTSPGAKSGGTGKHADRILIDDPIDAQAADAEAQTTIDAANAWYDGTLSTRFADPKTGVEVIIMQRLHENDLAGHALEISSGWHVLCLPEEYETDHPNLTPGEIVFPSGRKAQGDVREVAGELLWPERIGPEENAARKQKLTAHRAAGQLQQRPAPREGAILKRADWRYYPKSESFYATKDDPVFSAERVLTANLPSFERVVHSWDTSLKDHAEADFAVGTVWGAKGADLYLLRIWRERAGLNQIVEGMLELHRWAVERWPNARMNVLVEKAATGPEAIVEIQRRVQGVLGVPATVSKEMRAEAAAAALESHNIFLPGRELPDFSSYGGETPPEVQAFVEELAVFNKGRHDDQVDSWSQAVNWLRRQGRPARASTGIPRGRA